MVRRKASFIAAVAALFMLFAAPNHAWAQQEAGQADTGDLISALNNTSAQIDQLNTLDGLTAEDVQVVSIGDVLDETNVEAYSDALDQNQMEIEALRGALEGNEIIQNALTQSQVTLDDVVAVNVLESGDVIVYYQ